MNVRCMVKDGGQIPRYGTIDSAGADLVSSARCEWTPIYSEPFEVVEDLSLGNYAQGANVQGLQKNLNHRIDNIKVKSNPIQIIVGWKCIVSTGFYVELPQGFEMQVRPRSGSAFKYNVTIINAPGTIDEDYRGEVKVALMVTGELSSEMYDMNESAKGQPEDTRRFLPKDMKIAQVVLASVDKARFILAEQLGKTNRGDKGFGSTGVKVEGQGGNTIDASASICIEFNVGDIHLMGVTAGTMARFIKSLEEYNKDFKGIEDVYEANVPEEKAMFVTYDVYEFDYNKADLLDRIKNAVDLVGGKDVVQRAYLELPEKKKSY